MRGFKKYSAKVHGAAYAIEHRLDSFSIDALEASYEVGYGVMQGTKKTYSSYVAFCK